MIEGRPKLRYVKTDRLELWEEASVRKEGALSNIADLATSLKKNGMRLPLLVRRDGRSYRVFSGQRRFEAAKIARLREVPCHIFEKISLRDAMMISLTENALTEAVSREDKSRAASLLLKMCGGAGKASRVMGVSESAVRGYLRYEDVPAELRDFAKRGLSAKNIEDIYAKFPRLEDAVDVAEDLAGIAGRKKRSAYGAAIRRSASTDRPADIRKRAARMEGARKITVWLDEDHYQALSRAALLRRRSDEEMTAEIVEGWQLAQESA